MKKLLIIFLTFLFLTNFANSQSRFGELTEIRDEKMRGKDNQWVRPHPGPFIWNHIEKVKGEFNWEETDQYVVYAQENNQTILATIWPHANWEQKSCKRKKAKSPFGKRFTKYLSKPCSMDDYKNFLVKLIDRYDGDGLNDMPGLTKPIKYWDVMNEPEFKMFFKGTEDEFVEIFNFSSKLIKSKQKDAVIIMAGAAGMFPESKNTPTKLTPMPASAIRPTPSPNMTRPNRAACTASVLLKAVPSAKCEPLTAATSAEVATIWVIAPESTYSQNSRSKVGEDTSETWGNRAKNSQAKGKANKNRT